LRHRREGWHWHGSASRNRRGRWPFPCFRRLRNRSPSIGEVSRRICHVTDSPSRAELSLGSVLYRSTPHHHIGISTLRGGGSFRFRLCRRSGITKAVRHARWHNCRRRWRSRARRQRSRRHTGHWLGPHKRDPQRQDRHLACKRVNAAIGELYFYIFNNCDKVPVANPTPQLYRCLYLPDDRGLF